MLNGFNKPQEQSRKHSGSNICVPRLSSTLWCRSADDSGTPLAAAPRTLYAGQTKAGVSLSNGTFEKLFSQGGASVDTREHDSHVMGSP
jgi:hypothetical protein